MGARSSIAALALRLGTPLRDQFGGEVTLRCHVLEVAKEAMGDVGCLSHDECILFIVDLDDEQVAGI